MIREMYKPEEEEEDSFSAKESSDGSPISKPLQVSAAARRQSIAIQMRDPFMF